MLKRLAIKQIIEHIQNEKTFSAITPDNAFTIIINEYVPYICTAIHNGGNLRPRLRTLINLNKMERWQEEDPLTGLFISSLPIQIICNDSRYEYDLNKAPNECVYDIIWDKKVWSKTITQDEMAKSQYKHNQFYQVLEALIHKLTQKYKQCLLYDIHSYNYKLRQYPIAPLFNIGTKNLNKNKYRLFINNWFNELDKIKIPHVKNLTTKNTIFSGNGYLVKHISTKFTNVLVLPTEIKKVYLDEISGDEYPNIINILTDRLKEAIVNNTLFFTNQVTSLKLTKKHQLLSSSLDTAVVTVDETINNIYKKIDLLDFINPTNAEAEKRKFFKSHFRYNPHFTYPFLNVSTKELKKQLYQVNIEAIKDIDIRNLYRDVIEEYVSQLDLISARGTKMFLYNSLKHYGEPGEKDTLNASYLMHCLEIPHNDSHLEIVDANEVAKYFQNECQRYQLDYKIQLVKNMAAQASFSPAQKKIKIKKDAQFTKRFALGLSHHEVGVHAVTTFNAQFQPLKVLQTGLPGNTTTQEGLALMSEFLSGYLDVERLQEVALRVIAVHHMVNHYDFSETFLYLIDNHNISHEKAFTITLRVYRGGGFTKDYVYLKGLREVINIYKRNKNHFNYLLTGKTSGHYLPLLEELVQRSILKQPKIITHTFRYPKKPNAILEYVINGLA